MDLKVPFGLKNNQLVHVSDVELGLKCECRCPACDHPLVAKNKGTKKTHHFSHHKAPQCKYAFETAIHMAAKKVIEDAGYIILPKLGCEIINGRKRLLFKDTKVRFDQIRLEKRFHDIVPDIIIQKDGHQLCIEIFVTHEVDEEKRKKIETNKLSAIEIDLSKTDRAINFESLKAEVINSTDNKKWLFNARRYELHSKVLNSSIAKEIRSLGSGGMRIVLQCPLHYRTAKALQRYQRIYLYDQQALPASAKNDIARGLAIQCDDCPVPPIDWKDKPYADVDDKCIKCLYYVRPLHNDGKIYCVGHKTKEEIIELLKSQSVG